MKKTVLIIAITSIAIASVNYGCKTSSEKVDDAQIKVMDAKTDLKTVQKDSLTDAQKAANVEQWKIFRNESQVKIKNNEIRISALKIKIKNEGVDYNSEKAKRIDSLEIKNKELAIRMENYEKGKSDWETFKLDFTRDIAGLGESLKNFTVRNKGK